MYSTSKLQRQRVRLRFKSALLASIIFKNSTPEVFDTALFSLLLVVCRDSQQYLLADANTLPA